MMMKKRSRDQTTGQADTMWDRWPCARLDGWLARDRWLIRRWCGAVVVKDKEGEEWRRRKDEGQWQQVAPWRLMANWQRKKERRGRRWVCWSRLGNSVTISTRNDDDDGGGASEEERMHSGREKSVCNRRTVDGLLFYRRLPHANSWCLSLVGSLSPIDTRHSLLPSLCPYSVRRSGRRHLHHHQDAVVVYSKEEGLLPAARQL